MSQSANRSARFLCFLCSFWGLLLVACASSGAASGGGGTGEAVLVTLRNFKSGERFELASESHTKRVEYYSGQRTDAARKIQSDEVMSAFLDELERQGFSAHAQPGKAPSIASGDVIRWGLELEHGEDHRHWLIGTGSAGDDIAAFQKCRDTFLQLYNVTVSYQTVHNDTGKQYFQDSKGTPKPH